MSRSSVDWRSGSTKNYKEFCKNHPSIKISIEDWRKIIYAFSDEFKAYILETGHRVKMPEGMGSFSIQKKKRRQFVGENNQYINLPIDWQKTKNKGKYIYNFNFHTEGFYFGWHWFRPATAVRHAQLWHFKATRVTSRLLAHYLKTDPKYMNLYKNWSLT
jgi:nucleoid DNA-binding protein